MEDYINQILNTVKNSPNPELYYLALAVALIFVFYVVNKILKVVTFVLIIVALGLGFAAMQGQDINAVLTTITSSANQLFSGTANNNNFNPSPVPKTPVNPSIGQKIGQQNEPSSSDIEKLISDLLSKLSGGK